jgi:hypothetical protein
MKLLFQCYFNVYQQDESNILKKHSQNYLESVKYLLQYITLVQDDFLAKTEVLLFQ